MVRKLEALIIDLIVSINLDYLKKTVRNLFILIYLLQICKEVLCKGSPLKL